MRLPYIVTHTLDNESKTATLGQQIFWVATAGLFIRLPGGVPLIGSNDWLLCVAISSLLIGGKLVAESVIEVVSMKLGKPAAPAPAAPQAAA